MILKNRGEGKRKGVGAIFVLAVFVGTAAFAPLSASSGVGGFGEFGEVSSEGSTLAEWSQNHTVKVNSTTKELEINYKYVPEEEWSKTFGGSDYDFARSVQQTTDGGYIIAGETESYGAGSYDFWLVKTDSDGNKVWDKTFGGVGWDGAYSVQQTTDGGYIVAGFTDSYGAGGCDFWLVKTDANGNKVWDKTFGGARSDGAKSVQQTADGGYIIAGATYSYGAGVSDFWLVKTDEKGNKVWDKTFGGARSDWAESVQQTADEGFIIASTESYGAGVSDFWLVKTDENGNKDWDKTFGGSGFDRASSVQQTADGGFILAGRTYSYGAGSYDAWLVKTDANGNKDWDKTFGGARSDWAESVQQTADEGFIIAGLTDSYGAGSSDFWLVKVKGEEPTEPAISIQTDKREYSPGETMTVTLGFKNPTASSVKANFIWYLDWLPILSTALTLPPKCEQSYEFSIPVGEWSPVGFEAAWYVALLEQAAPHETICEDSAAWRFVPTAATTATTTTQTQVPKEVAEQIARELEVEREEFAAA
ncbi:MAG: hypothetical protein C4B55_06740 [Candidatus Methanophagaceae archaeon]|nr:MAG: hypothetical protein C4B55_06740 [Methanophagales archaeon]